MIRTNSARKNHKVSGMYVRRSSVYAYRSVHGVHTKPLAIKRANTASKVASTYEKSVLASDTEQYILPPKQPTPSVILRKDIMAKQRTRVSL
jgi:hypothetical protein